MLGSLYIVATPIGNLEDITLRAIRVLGEAAVVACEDTRQTIKLLNKYGIRKELISYYQPREGRKIPLLMDILKKGKNIALVSDSGTPGISDPGFRLIREALKEGIRVIPVPGPAAFVSALTASGLPCHRFTFAGFPPPKKEAARKWLRSMKDEAGTLIFYLPARKAAEFLRSAAEILGERPVVVARELTKIYEEFLRGNASEVLALIENRVLKGEITLLVGGKQD